MATIIETVLPMSVLPMSALPPLTHYLLINFLSVTTADDLLYAIHDLPSTSSHGDDNATCKMLHISCDSISHSCRRYF